VSAARARRAERVVGLRARKVEALELELAQLSRQAAEAQAAVAHAGAEWEAAARAPVAGTCISGDLADAHAFLDSLARRIHVRRGEAQEAQRSEAAGRDRVRDARVELKKIENWRDRLIQAALDVESLAERRATDEVAARIARHA
jgi:flagellar export protein FliJ